MHKSISFFFSLIMVAAVTAQSSDDIASRFSAQLLHYPHEKIYIQTDKPTYLSGERIWLRSHLVEASSHLPFFLSRYVYVELFNPFNQLIDRVKVRPDSVGVFSGYLDLNEELPEGTYTIRAYTRYMRNRGNEAFYRKTIQVLDPHSLKIDPVADFVVNGDKVKVTFSFVEPDSGNIVVPDIVTVKLEDEITKTISSKNNADFNWEFNLTKKRSARSLLLGIVHNGRKYNKYFPIPYESGNFDVTFHPEGGYLIPGQLCWMGFKAINPSGLGEDITGILFNSKDEEIGQFKTMRLGMGIFNFIPLPDERYYAVCKSESGDTKRIDLPLPNPQARAITAMITNNGRIIASALRGGDAPNDSLSILVHSRGMVYFHRVWSDPSKPYSFETNNFPSGIIGLLLLNNRNEILSERLLFNHNANDFIDFETRFSAPSYGPRQLVRIALRFADTDTIAPYNDMAVSVTDKNAVPSDTVSDLLATLLLSSELKGFVESPASYFKGYRIADKYALDALMLTQGWRRYDIPALLQGEIAIPEQFDPEQFQEIKGKADGVFGGLKGGEISLFATLDSLTNGQTVTADEKGRFLFKVEYPEGTDITVQSLSKKGGRRNLINIEPETFPDNQYGALPVFAPAWNDGRSNDELLAYMQKADKEYVNKVGARTIMLEEVTVTAKKMEKYKESTYYSPLYASGLVTAEDIEKRKYSSLRSLLIATPGLVVKGETVTTTRSERPVMFIIDDMPREDFYDQIDMIDVSAIDNLFVMKDNVGLLGFFPNTNGAVVITTKRGFVQRNQKSINIDRIKPLGYQQPAEFYMPKYVTREERENPLADLRTTIYWNPSVRFSDKGEALIEFYSADAPTTYRVVGEGVSGTGKIMRFDKEVEIAPSIQ